MSGMNPREQRHEKSLMIPYAMWIDVHTVSGYITPNSKFSKKTTYGLFSSRENIQYVTTIIRNELKKMDRPIDLGFPIARMMKNYRRIKTGEIERESTNRNPVIELAYRNREFIAETIRNIIIRNNPHDAEAHHQNLLMAFQNIDDTEFQEVDWGTRYAHLGDQRRNVYRWNNRIPADRVSLHQRHYERDITETLRDTRQLETPVHGYDMSNLVSNSSNRAFDNNEYTAY